jgi:hypothetical protein
MSPRRVSVFLLVMTGCTGAVSSPDAGLPSDGGILPADAGEPPVDAGLPAWLRGVAVGQWVEIPGTAGAGGAPADAYSGVALKDATSELLVAAAGGHGDSSDNRTVSIRLDQDAPRWVVRSPPSPTTGMDLAYNADGQPASMHTYSSTHYSAKVDRVMRVRPRFTFPSANDINTNDGFHLATNRWDGAGVHPLAMLGYGMVSDGDGNVWTSAFEKYDPETKQWTRPITTRTQASVRFPAAYDSRRRQLFTLQWGDGQGFNSGLSASRVPVDGTAQLEVTFTPGPGLTQWLADQPAYAGMDYDPVNDEFLFYAGGSWAGALTPHPERVFAITPSASGPWTLSVKPVTGVPAVVAGAGVQNRFRYVPALGGFVLLARTNAPLWFLRTRP